MTGIVPIVLLDEVSAHFDPRRRVALYERLAELGSQVWMTGADRSAFLLVLSESAAQMPRPEEPVDANAERKTGRGKGRRLGHPRGSGHATPTRGGAASAGQKDGGANLTQKGSPAQKTGRFGPRVGNLRLDYALPSVGLNVVGNGVFWPAPGAVGANWIDATDHHMVWVDIQP